MMWREYGLGVILVRFVKILPTPGVIILKSRNDGVRDVDEVRNEEDGTREVGVGRRGLGLEFGPF